MLPYIQVFGKVLPTYGVLGILGVLLGLALALVRCKRFGLSRDDCMYLYVFSALGAMVGAKLLYLLTVLPQLIADLPLLTRAPELFWERYVSGGMVFYGGLAGAIVGAVIMARIFRWRLTSFFPVLVPAFPLIHGIGRIGCFCAGCCYGIQVPVGWGVSFTQALAAPNHVPLLPIQLIEAGVEFLLCIVLLVCAERNVRPLRLLAIYFLSYAPARFVLEYFRGDAIRGSFWVLSTSQWLSIVTLAAGVLLMVLASRRDGRERAINEYKE